MLKLDNVKIVLFDFDDILCIHQNHVSKPEYEQRCFIKEIVGDITETSRWLDTSISTHLKDFVIECKKRGLEIGLVSWVENCKVAEAKQRWAEKRYGVHFENYCTSTAEGKIEIMQGVADYRGLRPDQILLVDDWWQTLTNAANAGFQAASPMECVIFMENSKSMEA